MRSKKKWRNMFRRICCFVLIVALTAGAFPVQTIAYEEAQAATEEAAEQMTDSSETEQTAVVTEEVENITTEIAEGTETEQASVEATETAENSIEEAETETTVTEETETETEETATEETETETEEIATEETETEEEETATEETETEEEIATASLQHGQTTSHTYSDENVEVVIVPASELSTEYFYRRATEEQLACRGYQVRADATVTYRFLSDDLSDEEKEAYAVTVVLYRRATEQEVEENTLTFHEVSGQKYVEAARSEETKLTQMDGQTLSTDAYSMTTDTEFCWGYVLTCSGESREEVSGAATVTIPEQATLSAMLLSSFDDASEKYVEESTQQAAHYEGNFTVTASGATFDGSEITDEEKAELLGNYSLKLKVIAPDESTEFLDVAGFSIETDNEGNSSIVQNSNTVLNYTFSKAGTYRYQAVLYNGDTEIAAEEAHSKLIMWPLTVSLADNLVQEKDIENVTMDRNGLYRKVSLKSSVDVTIDGFESTDVRDARKTKDQIKELLQDYCFRITDITEGENEKVVYSAGLSDNEEFVTALYTEPEHCVTFTAQVEIKKYSPKTYTYRVEVVKGVGACAVTLRSDTITLGVKKQNASFAYTVSEKSENDMVGETLQVKLTESTPLNYLLAGNGAITYKVLDEKDEECNDALTVVTTDSGETYTVTINQPGTYKLCFVYSGNTFYNSAEAPAITVEAQKEQITGKVDVYQEIFDKPGIMYRSDDIIVRVKLSATRLDILKSNLDKISLTDFKAVLQNTEFAGEEVPLGEGSFSYSEEEAAIFYHMSDPEKNTIRAAVDADLYEYKVEATLGYDSSIASMYDNCSIISDDVNKFSLRRSLLTIHVDGLDANNCLSMEASGEPQEIVFAVKDSRKNVVDKANLSIGFVNMSTNTDSSVEIVPNTYKVMTKCAGTTDIKISADDKENSKLDAYASDSIIVHVKVLPSSNVSYTIQKTHSEEQYDSIDEFKKAADLTFGGWLTEEEYWYNDTITIKPGADNIYPQIRYSADGGETWQTADGELVIAEKELSEDFLFFFVDEENGFYSYDEENKKNVVDDALKTIHNLAIDMDVPDGGNQLVADMAYSSHSTASMHYFGSYPTLKVYAKGAFAADEAVDGGVGVKQIKVTYQNGDAVETETIEVAEEERYESVYEISLPEDRTYGNISVTLIDYFGQESNAVIYKGAYEADGIQKGGNTPVCICVDTKTPVVIAVPYRVDAKGKLTAYDGSWTNQQLEYEVSLEEEQVSGIYQYQYAVIPRGTSFNADSAQWENISAATLKAVLGNKTEETTQTSKKGTLLYEATESSAETKTATNHSQVNGVIYFRAESNAGRMTTDDAMKNSAKEVRIWQEKPAVPKVYANKACDKTTGWYNKATGKVNISFAYPEYQAENYAPASGVVYELETKTEDGTKTVTKKFYRGIIDEKSGNVIEVTDYNKKSKKGSLAEDGTIKIKTDSINKLTVYIEDAAGNKSDKRVYTIKADYTAPESIKAVIDGTTQSTHSSKKDTVVYNTFAKESVTVKGVVDYGISEKGSLSMLKVKNIGDWSDMSKATDKEKVTIKSCYRGFVYLTATDGAGNTAEAWTDGIVVDDKAPEGEDAPDITITPKGANSNGFFNGDVTVSIKVKDKPLSDNFSGIRSVSYNLSNGDTQTKSETGLFNYDASGKSWLSIVKSASKYTNDSLVVSAAENEGNNAYIQVTATDQAGNTRTTTEVLKIDITEPVVDISFDKDNGDSSFYNEDRTATIRVTEKNFDPEHVAVTVERDGAVIDSMNPSADSWTNDGGDVYTSQIVFHEDGDYTLAVSCVDLADNPSEEVKSDEFTIDQTSPVVEVSYDNNDARNENYYNAARTATITVEEHNFDAGAFEASVTPHVSLSGWSNSGDTHTATLYFGEDEHYEYTLSCTDMAGNEMEAFETEEFYIDTTEPELAINGVEDESANAGDVIPQVAVADTNYDDAGVEITLTNSKGSVVSLEKAVSVSGESHVYTLTNVNGQPDEIYTLHVTGTDMAGNESELSMRFSLNRHGSTYDVSDVSALVEQVYTKYSKMEDIHIEEVNVSKVEEYELYISRNGELLTSVDSAARPADNTGEEVYYSTDVQGDDSVGYRYDYTIYKENFEQEGIYNITFYSKDSAGNEVNSTWSDKDAELTFVVDNTPPTVVIEGVESGEFYSEDSKNVNLYVSDNFALDKAEFYLVNEDGEQIGDFDYKELSDEAGEVVTVTLPNSSKRQSLTYYAADAAGNIAKAEETSENARADFMISTNMWLKFMNDSRAVAAAATVAGVATVSGAGGAFVFRRRKMRLRK